VGPFVDVNAQFSRYPGGRVEVRVAATSQAPRPVSRLEARVSCGDQRWLVQLDDLEAGGAAEKRIRLPAHQPCDGYRIGLESAWW
jgi:hypothetical protein